MPTSVCAVSISYALWNTLLFLQHKLPPKSGGPLSYWDTWAAIIFFQCPYLDAVLILLLGHWSYCFFYWCILVIQNTEVYFGVPVLCIAHSDYFHPLYLPALPFLSRTLLPWRWLTLYLCHPVTVWTLSLTLWVEARSVTHWTSVSPRAPSLLPSEALQVWYTLSGVAAELWSQQREQESRMHGGGRSAEPPTFPCHKHDCISELSNPAVDQVLKWLVTLDRISKADFFLFW